MPGAMRDIWEEEKTILGPTERRRVAQLMVGSVVAAAFEVTVLCAVYPVAAAVTGASPSPEFAWLSGHNASSLLIVFCILYTLRALVAAAFTYGVASTGQLVERNLRNRLFRRFLDEAALVTGDTRNSSVLSNTLSRTISQWTTSGASILSAGYQGMVALGILGASTALLDRREVIIPFAALGGIAFVAFMRAHRMRLRNAMEVEQETSQRILALVGQSVQALREIRVLGKAAPFAELLAEQGQRRFESARIVTLLTQAPRLASELLMFTVFGLVAFVYLGFYGKLDAFYPLFGMLLVATARLIPAISLVVSSTVAFRMHRVATEVIRQRVALLDSTGRPVHGAALPPFHGELKLDRLSFAYEGRPWALSELSWTIRPGTLVTVTGPSGSGKSTLLDLLAGFLAPASGRILVDGRDVAEVTASWQSQLGYLPQTVAMMSGTLADNVALGEPPETRNQEKLEVVTKLCLGDLVATFREGLQGRIDERGLNLSGGQRQRIGLARALYFDRKVLVFDEPTASLDRASAECIVELIATLRRTHTIIVATHDPAFDAVADDTLRLGAESPENVRRSA